MYRPVHASCVSGGIVAGTNRLECCSVEPMQRLALVGIFGVTLGCGGSTASGLEHTGGSTSSGGAPSGGSSSGGSSSGGSSAGGTSSGGTSSGGTSSGGTASGGSAGTGGASSGGSGGSSADACSAMCQKIDAAACQNEPEYPSCFAACQIDIASYEAECPLDSNALFACAAYPATVACDPDGDAKFMGCNGQLVQFLKCAGCVPSTADDACEACQKASCCAQLDAVYEHPQFPGYLGCVYNCTDSSCVSACYEDAPELAPAAQALAQCQTTACPSC
jgi:hypothetical protein